MIHLTADVEQIARIGMEAYAKKIESTMRSLAPVSDSGSSPPSHKSGTLRDSISTEHVGVYTYHIGPHVDYAYYAENGRGISRPRTKKAIAFYVGGHRIARKSASGFAGSHFVEKTANMFR